MSKTRGEKLMGWLGTFAAAFGVVFCLWVLVSLAAILGGGK